MTDSLPKTDQEWRALLSADEYRVTRRKGTEAPFTGKYNKHDNTGMYTCVCCSKNLFSSDDKFDSGTGWPSYSRPAKSDAVVEVADNSLFMKRTEVICGNCKAHLGHVFNDGPKPTGQRYCINSVSLSFKPR